MNTGNSAPSWRQITVVAVICILLAGFMLMYFYYYIPNNRLHTNQYGLRILHVVENNTRNKQQSLEKLYLNNLRSFKAGRGDSMYFTFNNVADSLRPFIIGDSAFPHPVRLLSDKFEVRVSHDTLYMSIAYQLKTAKPVTDSIRLGMLISTLIKPLTGYRHEFFESFALILVGDRHTGTLIFDDGAHGSLNTQISIDTFFAARQSDMFSRIIPLEIGAEKYMLFAQPFDLRTQPLLLCGIMKWEDYQQHVNTIPLPFILSVAIVFLLVLIYLPILKFQLIGKTDHVGFADILYITLSLFAGMTVLTLIVIQLVLLRSGELRSAAELHKLNRDVEARFYREVGEISQQLHSFDTLLARQLDDPRHGENKIPQVPLRVLAKPDATRVLLPLVTMDLQHETYYHFDRLTWTTSKGEQLFKAQRGGGSVVFIRDETRDYFKRFRNLQAYPQPLRPDSDFVIEPLYSQTTGDFRINYALRSHADTMFIITLTTQMYALTHTSFPAGYGYFLMDEQGQVLTHADPDRNLREYFPDETDHPDFVHEAINSRQDTFFTANYYGKDRSVFIHPLKQLPFFLVTYCVNEPRYASATRILVFALTYNLLVYLLVILFVWLFFFNPVHRSRALPLLEYFRWMIPRRGLAHFYKYGGVVALGAGLLLLLLALAGGRAVFDEHIIFAFGLIMPADVLVLLYTGYLRFYRRDALESRHWIPAIALGLVILGVYWIMRVGQCALGWQYVAIHLLLLLTLAWMLFSTKAVETEAVANPGVHIPYIRRYSWLVVCLGICIAVAPSIVFSLYAYDHEMAQSIKEQQLYLAEQLRNRRAEMWHVIFPELALAGPLDPVRDSVYEDALYRKSVYSLYDQQIYLLQGDHYKDTLQKYYDLNQRPESQSCYYFNVSNQLSAYHDVLQYPALDMASADSTWSWHDQRNALVLWYHYLPDAQLPGKGRQGMLVASHYPQAYYLLNKPLVVLILLVITFIIALGKYFRVRRLVKRLFLLLLLKDQQTKPLEAWKQAGTEAGRQQQALDTLKAEFAQRKTYADAWAKFSAEEKITLAQLATSGLTNIENDQALHSLMESGWLVVDQDMLRLREPAFAYFVKGELRTDDMKKLRKAAQRNSSWHTFKLPLQLLLLFAAVFVFFTQEGLFQRSVALIGSIGSMLGVLKNLPLSWGKPKPGGDMAGTTVNAE